MKQFLKCASCGKVVSGAFESENNDLVVRAYIECPECIEKSKNQVDLIKEEIVKELNVDSMNLINDLWLCVSFYLLEYPYDEDHKEKHKLLVKKAQSFLGIPENLEYYIKTKLEKLEEEADEKQN